VLHRGFKDAVPGLAECEQIYWIGFMKDFGIIIACCYQDYLFAKGCCASIRHFLNDVPICLIVDGTFDTSSLERLYGATVINHNTVKTSALRQRSFGWGLTKMIAFFESPWPHFLFLDADTNVWGNVLQFADFQNYDAILDKPCYTYTDAQICEFFFETSEIEKHFPEFPWQRYRDDYFCTGTFFAKRDLFTLEEYFSILDFHQAHPGIFKYGEMGFLNFMLFRAFDQGRIKLTSADMQVIAPDFPKDELAKRFPVGHQGPIVQGNDAAVIHWAGPKPRLGTHATYSLPMDFSRRKFLKDDRNLTGPQADSLLRYEDTISLMEVYKNKALKKLRKLKVSFKRATPTQVTLGKGSGN